MKKRSHAELLSLLKEELTRLKASIQDIDFNTAFNLIDEVEKSHNGCQNPDDLPFCFSFRNIIDTIPYRMLWKDKQKKIIGYNKKYKQCFAIRSENSDDVMLQALVKKEGDKLDDHILLGECEQESFDVSFLNNKNEEKHFIIKKNAILDQHGNVVGILESQIDITQTVLLKNKLVGANNLLNIVFDTIPVAVFWKDADFKFKYGNKQFLDTVGYHLLSDIEGKTDYDLKWAKEESDRFRMDDVLLRQTKEPLIGIVEKLTTAEGKTIWLKTHKAPIIAENGKFEGIIGIAENVTESRATKIALKHSEARLKSYFNNVTDGIFVLDEGFFIKKINPATFDITGYAENELINKRLFDLFNDDDLLTKLKTDCLMMDIQPVSGECSMIVNNCILKYLKVDVIKIEIDHYLCIVKDISELKRAIKKAQESNRLKTAFLQNISHEIRTPLNAIIGFSNILVRHMYDTEEEADKYKKIIFTNSEYLLGLVNSVIDLSKIETGQTNLNPEEIVLIPFLHNEVLPIIEAERNRLGKHDIRINLDTGKLLESMTMYVDANRLKQIIVNLMHNALKFTNKGSVSLRVKTKNDKLQFIVADTGIGISKDQQNHIFHRFYKIINSQQVSMGSGLGLSIVKKLLQLMDGNIMVSSKEGKGSKFIFDLPIIGK